MKANDQGTKGQETKGRKAKGQEAKGQEAKGREVKNQIETGQIGKRVGLRLVDAKGELIIGGSIYFTSSSLIGQSLQIYRDGQGYYGVIGGDRRPYRLQKVRKIKDQER